MKMLNLNYLSISVFMLIFISFVYQNKSFSQNLISQDTDTLNSFTIVYSSVENDTCPIVVFNSYNLIPGFATSVFKNPWNPTEFEMKSIFQETNDIFYTKIINMAPWQQYVCGLDSVGNKIVFVRYIVFTEQTSDLKEYFLNKIIFVYDNKFIHTMLYNYSTKSVILFN